MILRMLQILLYKTYFFFFENNIQINVSLIKKIGHLFIMVFEVIPIAYIARSVYKYFCNKIDNSFNIILILLGSWGNCQDHFN